MDNGLRASPRRLDDYIALGCASRFPYDLEFLRRWCDRGTAGIGRFVTFGQRCRIRTSCALRVVDCFSLAIGSARLADPTNSLIRHGNGQHGLVWAPGVHTKEFSLKILEGWRRVRPNETGTTK
jgi:hypothetical protein